MSPSEMKLIIYKEKRNLGNFVYVPLVPSFDREEIFSES